MAVKIAFVEDPFRKNGAVFSRQVQWNTMEFEKVLELMRVGSAFSVGDMRSVFQNFSDFLARYLPEGTQVQTPIGTYCLCLPQDRSANAFAEPGTPAERKISLDNLSIRLKADRELIARIKSKIDVQIVRVPDTSTPRIYSVENTERDGVFNAGSVGDVLRLSGDALSFPKSDNAQGVFFVDGEKGVEVRAPCYSRIGSNILNFKIPSLPAGSYQLEVRTKSSGNKIRVGVYASQVSVS
jgi:hypothetical protein